MMSKKGARVRSIWVGGLLSAVLAIGISGCNDHITTTGTDLRYLMSATSPSPNLSANYFPANAGDQWVLKGAGGSKTFMMDIKVVSSKHIGNASESVFQISLNHKPIEEEVYTVNKAGASRTAVGPKASLHMNPPMPLIQYPLRNGDTFTWQGTMKGASLSVPVQNYCQVSGPVTVNTAAGRFHAYQLDMMNVVTVKQNTIHLPSTFWFAPNVGMVKQETAIKGLRVTAALQSYRIK